jgi:hypothetical protein
MKLRSPRLALCWAIGFSLLAGVAGCGSKGSGSGGGGGGGGTNVTVSITTPNTATASVGVNLTLALTAVVSGNCVGAGCGVTWSVNGIEGGNSTFGTIQQTGLSATFDAPAAVPSPATFNVTATSVANSSESASVAVTITSAVTAVSITDPANLTQTLSVNGTLPITASVAGNCGNNCGVSWAVNGVANGNSTFGTISGSGLSVIYDAPAAVPTPATFNVTAASVADPSQSASVSVTIVSGVVVSIVKPAISQTLPAGSTLNLLASVTGTTNTGVNWTVNGILNGNSTYGAISGQGLSVTYDAPTSIPSPSMFNLTATSLADSTKSASVSVTIVPSSCGTGSESVLKGQYAFNLAGYNANGFSAVVGSIAVDGMGNITGGEADANDPSGTHSTGAISAGTYSVGSDNRGCATIVTNFGTFTTRFELGAMTNNVATAGNIMEYDPANSSAYIAAGQIFLEATGNFSAGLNGGYMHLLAGWDRTNGNRIACAGVHTSGNAIISGSEQTCNEAGTITQTGPTAGNVGSYSTIDSYGRFTETVNSSHLVAYEISSSAQATVPTALVLTTDASPVMAGAAYAQTGAFSQSSLSNDYVIYANGVNNSTSGKIFFGLVSGDGVGTLTINNYYENDGGTWVPGNVAPSYNFVVDSYGGILLSTNTIANAGHLYITGTGIGAYVGVDTGAFAGFAAPQTGNGALGNSSVNGTFFGGTTAVVSQGSAVEGDIAILNGSGDVSDTSDTTSTTNQQTDQMSGPTVSIAANGTFTTNSSGSQVVGVVINPDYFLLTGNVSSPYPTVLLFGPAISPP